MWKVIQYGYVQWVKYLVCTIFTVCTICTMCTVLYNVYKVYNVYMCVARLGARVTRANTTLTVQDGSSSGTDHHLNIIRKMFQIIFSF